MKTRLLLCLVMMASTMALQAQELRVNDAAAQVNLPLGKQHTITLTGPAGAPHYWVFDTDPGPVQAFGLTIPLGLTPNFIDIGLGAPFSASGQSTLSFATTDAGLVGISLYSAALFLDPMQGPLLTNGIGFTFVEAGAEAGGSGAAFVGQPATLDGSGNLDAMGQLPVGTNPQWTIVDGPTGNMATLSDDQSAFPSLTADLPGLYVVELAITTPAGLSADQVTIYAYDVAFTSLTDGQFVNGAFPVQGTFAGPDAGGLQINGTSVMAMGGTFDAGMIMPTDIMNPITATVVAPLGDIIEKTITVINGSSASLANAASPSAWLRLSGTSLDTLEAPVEIVLAQLPLNQIITALPPIPLVPSGTFTATLDFTGATFDTNNVDFDLFPSSNNIGVGITLNTLNITGDVTGTAFGFPYSETITISAASVTITGELVLGSNAQNELEVTIANSQTNFTSFNVQVTGVLGLFSGILSPLIQTAFETALSGFLDLVPTTLNPLLAQVPLTTDLTASGIPLQLDLPLNGVLYDMDGLTIVLDSQVTPLSTTPNAPVISDYLSSGSVLPTFGTTTPNSMTAYDIAAGIAEDGLNQFLAGATATGALDQSITGSIGTGMGALLLTAGDLATALPGVGFEAFDAQTPVTLDVHFTTAPVITLDGGSTGGASAYLGNIELDLVAEPTPGTFVKVLAIGATADASLSIMLDAMASTLTVTPGAVNTVTTLRGALSGRLASPALASVDMLVQQAIPLVTAALSNIPLPTAGLGGTVVEIDVPTATEDSLTGYVDLP